MHLKKITQIEFVYARASFFNNFDIFCTSRNHKHLSFMCNTAYFEQIVHHQRGQLWYAYLYIKQNKCRFLRILIIDFHQNFPQKLWQNDKTLPFRRLVPASVIEHKFFWFILKRDRNMVHCTCFLLLNYKKVTQETVV